MGAFLSEPVKDKTFELGAGQGVRFVAGSMQGWRREMEDAHIAVPDLSKDVRLFGVFDGHGGKEVALFCRRHLARELAALPEFREGDMPRALARVFHRIDEMLEEDVYREELRSLEKMNAETVLPTLPDKEPAPLPPAPPASSVSSATDDAGLPPNGASLMELLKAANAMPDSDDDDDEMMGEEEEAPARGGGVAPGQGRRQGNNRRAKRAAAAGAGRGSGGGGGKGGKKAVVAGRGGGKPDAGKEKSKISQIQAITMLRQMLSGGGGGGGGAGGSSSSSSSSSSEQTGPASMVDAFGNRYCNLPEHPIQAGCTAVVALLHGSKLYVANAGDSRGVLCRGGKTVELSHDHKPHNDTEKTRVEAAGGFVTAEGRVNGSLNLSRALGDLKFKNNKELPRTAQLITAEPDIEVFDISPEDEFMVLACDGVWDVLSNEEVVEFVRSRLPGRRDKLQEIAKELLDRCLSSNPRDTNGMGTDNMTALIVLLKDE